MIFLAKNLADARRWAKYLSEMGAQYSLQATGTWGSRGELIFLGYHSCDIINLNFSKYSATVRVDGQAIVARPSEDGRIQFTLRGQAK